MHKILAITWVFGIAIAIGFGLFSLYNIGHPIDVLGADLRVLLPVQGGTGISTTSPTGVGKCLKVLSDSPFKYELASCGGGAGSQDWIKNTALDGIRPTSTVGIVVSASSTIGGNTNTTGLTIKGGATTTGDAYFGGLLTIGNSGNAIYAPSTDNIAMKTQGTDRLFVNNNGQVAIGVNNYDRTFNITGDGLMVRTADNSKGFRARFGGATDFESTGDLYLSTWSGAGFSGTQYNQITLRGNGNPVEFARTAVPDTNLSYNFGGTSNYWNNFYGRTLNLNSSASLDGTTAGVVAVTGNVGIGTTTPRLSLDVNGNVIFNDLAPFQALIPPLQLENEEIITTFQSGHGFTYSTGGGSSSDDTSDFSRGTQSLKVTTDSAGTQSRVQNLSMTPFSVVNKSIRAIFKLNKNLKTTDQLFIGFSSDNFTNYFYCSFTYDAFQEYYGESWFESSCSPSNYNVTGTPDFNNIKAVRLYVRAASGVTENVWFQKISLVPNNTSRKPIIAITFDDGSKSQFDKGMPYLSKYGFPATAFVETDNVGTTAFYMTKDELSKLQYENGWDISAHGAVSFANLTYNEQENTIIKTKNWLIKNGFGKGADGFAYPNGEMVSTSTLPLMRKYFTYARQSATGLHETLPVGNRYKLHSYSVQNTTATSTIYSEIDKAIANNDILILTFHQIVDSNADNSTKILTRDFEYIIDYINSKKNQIEVKTLSDVFNLNDTTIPRYVKGRLGIGTSTPNATLTLSGNATSTGSIFNIFSNYPSSGSVVMNILNTGNVGIGTTTPSSKLTVFGHVGTDGAIPALTSCGTSPAITLGSTDTAGEITEGSGATGCTITFASAYTTTPFCTVTEQSGLAASYTISTSTITITNIGALSNTKINYVCVSND